MDNKEICNILSSDCDYVIICDKYNWGKFRDVARQFGLHISAYEISVGQNNHIRWFDINADPERIIEKLRGFRCRVISKGYITRDIQDRIDLMNNVFDFGEFK